MNKFQLTRNNFLKETILLLMILCIGGLVPAVAYSQTEPMVVQLLAGQHIPVGTVTVTGSLKMIPCGRISQTAKGTTPDGSGIGRSVSGKEVRDIVASSARAPAGMLTIYPASV